MKFQAIPLRVSGCFQNVISILKRKKKHCTKEMALFSVTQKTKAKMNPITELCSWSSLWWLQEKQKNP